MTVLIPVTALRAYAVAVFALLLGTAQAAAWDLFGHHVVGAIAWHHMEPSTRQAVVALLREAPRDADLASLLPPGPRPFELRAREMFLRANGWADIVRDEAWPERKKRYDRPTWHYVNRFWRPSATGPRVLVERGTSGELVDRLEILEVSAVDPSRSPPERAIDLAWILHLVGDVHQPLHSSARVTEREPDGDRGGNDFLLDDPESWTLHGYWDTILRRARPRRHSESYFRWVSRIADELETTLPKASLRQELLESGVELWSKNGARIAMSVAYPDSLERESAPPREYEETVFFYAARQVPLAAYRLAEVLNAIFSR